MNKLLVQTNRLELRERMVSKEYYGIIAPDKETLQRIMALLREKYPAIEPELFVPKMTLPPGQQPITIIWIRKGIGVTHTGLLEMCKMQQPECSHCQESMAMRDMLLIIPDGWIKLWGPVSVLIVTGLAGCLENFMLGGNGWPLP